MLQVLLGVAGTNISVPEDEQASLRKSLRAGMGEQAALLLRVYRRHPPAVCWLQPLLSQLAPSCAELHAAPPRQVFHTSLAESDR